MLPQDKTDFPKCLYLDQNMWIGLAQAARGLPLGERFQEALAAIRIAVDSGKLLVPLSLVHIIETAIPGRPERRVNLIEFMLSLSRNLSIRHYKQVRPLEIENSIRRWYGLGDLHAIRPQLIVESAFPAVGASADLSQIPAEWLSLVESVIRSAAIFQTAFTAISDERDAIRNAVAQEMTGAGQLQQIRDRSQQQLTDRQRELLNYALMFKENAIENELVNALQRTGVPLERWVTDILSKPDEIIHFAEDVPFIDVFVRLNLLHCKNTSKVFEGHDVRDLVWMAVALPYCNIIAGETYWTTLGAPLAGKYRTVLTNRPEDLPAILNAEGCR